MVVVKAVGGKGGDERSLSLGRGDLGWSVLTDVWSGAGPRPNVPPTLTHPLRLAVARRVVVLVPSTLVASFVVAILLGVVAVDSVEALAVGVLGQQHLLGSVVSEACRVRMPSLDQLRPPQLRVRLLDLAPIVLPPGHQLFGGIHRIVRDDGRVDRVLPEVHLSGLDLAAPDEMGEVGGDARVAALDEGGGVGIGDPLGLVGGRADDEAGVLRSGSSADGFCSTL